MINAKKILTSLPGWLVILVGINMLAAAFHTRIDLTREKRYTLSSASSELVRSADSDIQIDVFLKGEFPAGFRKLANSTDEFLRLLKDRNGSKVHYRFINPQDNMPGTQGVYADSLVAMGAVPINLTVQKEAGESSNIIFPVAIITYNGRSALVNLYPGASGRISQDEINSAEALMEYQFTNSLSKLMNQEKAGIAYSVGNGEPVDGRTYDLRQTLIQDYQFGLLNLNTQPGVPDGVDVLMIVKPTIPFTEEEKFKIDQFVMRGGKLLCFIDNLIAEQDSLAFKPETIAYDRNLNLTDLFFRYGLRINTDLVMDLQCDLLPFIVGGSQETPQYEFLRWNYYPLLTPAANQSVNRNPGYVVSKFANSIDTIKVNDVIKTPLLVSSPNSRIISTPALISLNENKNVPQDEKFNRNAIPVAMHLKGKFTSLYRNRVTKSQMDTLQAQGLQYRANSEDNQVIVVADGDIVLNDFIPNPGGEPLPLPMGWNKFTYSEYEKNSEYGKLFIPVANNEFFRSSLEQLVNSTAISQLRNKDIVLRLLDTQKVKASKTTWQLINIVLPVLLIMLFGWLHNQLRKNRYGGKAASL
jgi:gliding-associated putative ABC transporter substrate-binding component GldG